MSKPNNSSLGNAIAVCLCGAGMWWGITMRSPIVGICTSLASWAALQAHKERYGYTIRDVLGECLEASAPLLESTAERLKANKPDEDDPLVVRYGYKFLSSFLGGDSEPDDYAWFKELKFGVGEGLMPYGNWLIAGDAREGKSSAARHLFCQYMEQHPGCQVLVCDIERDSHAEENYWFGCPVADTHEKVVRAFQRDVQDYLTTTKGDGSAPGLVIMFDEVKETLKDLNEEHRNLLISTLQSIATKGRKRKVVCIQIMDTFSEDVLGWKGITDYVHKASIIMLQRFASDASNFSSLLQSENLTKVRADLAEYDPIPYESAKPRPCLLYVDKQWSVRLIPPIKDVKLLVRDAAEPLSDLDTVASDRYAPIREYINGVELPDKILTLSKLHQLCGVADSRHHTEAQKYDVLWKQFLDEHNARVDASKDNLNRMPKKQESPNPA